MKTIIVSCLPVIAGALISGCASDSSHRKTTTTQRTTTAGPITTTITETKTK